jgi:hypothetical protein
MSSLQEFLQRLLSRFNDLGIAYVIVGSVASTLHGEVRTTQDVDVVVDATLEQLRSFVSSLGKEYYASVPAAEDAWRRKAMFNVIDLETGWKADLIVLGDDALEREKFQRRIPWSMEGLQIFIQTPEDVILSKLRWFKLSNSDRQMRDAIGVAITQWDALDHAYLSDRAGRMDVVLELDAVYREARKVLGIAEPDVPF